MLVCLAVVTGCGKGPPPEFRFNAVEWLKQERFHLSDDKQFDEKFKTEIGSVTTALFGTPDDPKFPFLLGDEDPAHEILSLDNLRMAAGAVKSDKDGVPRGLYREHCAHCHGVTGDGAGPTAAMLNPYPRDFRLGKFKFKSTPLRKAPTDHDLETILRNGIPGTAMPSFRSLPEPELEALVDYVKYLTIRGQFERMLMAEVAGVEGDAIFDFALIDVGADGGEPSDDDVELFEDVLYTIIGEQLRDGIIQRWIDPEKRMTTIAPAPRAFDLQHESHDEFVQTGRELFGSKGNCMQCHGETGMGDGVLNNFDDWANDWIKSAQVDPFIPETYQDFMAAGALSPRPIRPRNLHLPVFRGGNHPDEIYLRIANGIEGTPMPSSTALSSDEIWALVAYVRSVPFEDGAEKKHRPLNKKQIAR